MNKMYRRIHIPAPRLLTVADRDNGRFDFSELEHLKKCGLCVDRFSLFLRQRMQSSSDRSWKTVSVSG